MAEQFVGRLSEFTDGSRQIVKIGNTEVGIFRHEGEFFAYSNYCLHQGGPACEGLTIAKVEELLREDKTSMGLFFSEKDICSSWVLENLTSKMQLLTSIDKCWAIEAAVAHSLMRLGGLAKLQSRALDCLPAEKSPVSLDHASGLLEKMSDTVLYKISSRDNQRVVDMLREIVQNMRRGQGPKVAQLITTPFGVLVNSRLDWFLSCDEGLLDGQLLGTTVYGRAALTLKLKLMEKKEADGSLCFDDLSELHVFAHLCLPAETTRVETLTSELLARVAAGPAAKRPRPGASSGAASSGSSTDLGVMALFG